MGYWGWRPLVLVLFISVWVTGCTDTVGNAPQSTALPVPSPTLWVRARSSPIPEPTPGLAIRVASPAHAAPASPAQGHRVVAPPPSCYETPQQAILCIGEITNASPHPLVQVRLQVQLLDAQGAVLGSVDTLVEQRLILSGERAPYSALFPMVEGDSLLADFAGVYTLVRRADEATTTGTPVLSTLTVDSLETGVEAGVYVMRGAVVNPFPEPVEALRVVGTAYDGAGRVTGYRVLLVDALAGGARLPVHLEIVPQSPPGAGDLVRLTLHVDALRTQPQP